MLWQSVFLGFKNSSRNLKSMGNYVFFFNCACITQLLIFPNDDLTNFFLLNHLFPILVLFLGIRSVLQNTLSIVTFIMTALYIISTIIIIILPLLNKFCRFDFDIVSITEWKMRGKLANYWEVQQFFTFFISKF